MVELILMGFKCLRSSSHLEFSINIVVAILTEENSQRREDDVQFFAIFLEVIWWMIMIHMLSNRCKNLCTVPTHESMHSANTLSRDPSAFKVVSDPSA